MWREAELTDAVAEQFRLGVHGMQPDWRVEGKTLVYDRVMNKGKVEVRRIAVIPEGPRGRGEETKLGTLYPQVRCRKQGDTVWESRWVNVHFSPPSVKSRYHICSWTVRREEDPFSNSKGIGEIDRSCAEFVLLLLYFHLLSLVDTFIHTLIHLFQMNSWCSGRLHAFQIWFHPLCSPVEDVTR